MQKIFEKLLASLSGQHRLCGEIVLMVLSLEIFWTLVLAAQVTQDPSMGPILAVLALSAMGSGLILRRLFQSSTAENLSHFMLIKMFAVILSCSILEGFAFHISTIWLISVPVISAVLLSRIALIVWTTLTLAVACLLVGFSSLSSPGLLTLPVVPLAVHLALLGAFLIAAHARHLRAIDTDNRMQHDKANVLVQIVTHDIANPMTIVSGVCRSRLKKIGDDHAERKHWERVAKATNNMLELLDEVKRLHALQSGKISFTLRPTSLQQAIQNGQFTFENRLQDKDLELKVDLHGEEDHWFHGEPISFCNEILNNLLSNAIKFSPRGATIHLQAQTKDQWVHLQVSDKGIGMPQSLIDILFDEYKPTSRQGTEGEKGTGFGMPLMKHIAEAFGGSVQVESRCQSEHPHDHGTTFHIFLPASDPGDRSDNGGGDPGGRLIKIA